MTLPLWYALIPFAAIVLFTSVFLFFNVFHLLRYGVKPGNTKLLVWAYLGSFALLMLFSLLILLSVDWSYQVPLDELIPGSSRGQSLYNL